MKRKKIKKYIGEECELYFEEHKIREDMRKEFAKRQTFTIIGNNKSPDLGIAIAAPANKFFTKDGKETSLVIIIAPSFGDFVAYMAAESAKIFEGFVFQSKPDKNEVTLAYMFFNNLIDTLIARKKLINKIHNFNQN